jgi:3-carboxy-cis,cis-muconate cycloisomerase
LAQAEAKEGVIPEERPRRSPPRFPRQFRHGGKLRQGTARDGVVVPEFVRQLRAMVGEPHGGSVHFGATSQDVIDTSWRCGWSNCSAILGGRLDRLVERLPELEERQGTCRDHGAYAHAGGAAGAGRAQDRSWREPLLRHRDRMAALEATSPSCISAARSARSTSSATRASACRAAWAKLGLGPSSASRHSERDGQAALANWLSMVTGSLGKMGQDIALLAQTEVGEVKLASGGGSSAMPHKVNPVGAEVLVALARFNATLVSGMHHSLVHENERSGAAWTLEWMLLPQMAVATAAALRTADGLVEGLSFAGRPAPLSPLASSSIAAS